jgi:hypothetical protein
MNVPVLLADAILNDSTGVSVGLALTVGGGIIVLIVGVAEARLKTGSQDKRLDAIDGEKGSIASVRIEARQALEEAKKEIRNEIFEAKRESEKDRSEMRSKLQVMEVGQAEVKVIMAEVRAQQAVMAEAQRDQTRMMHELLSRSESGQRRRSTDAA